MIPVSQLAGTEFEKFEKFKSNIAFGIHVALPCIVQSYNAATQTVEAQPTIRERVTAEDGQLSYIQYPLLINVPVVFPRAGGFSILFPVKKGDECLVVFSDLAIDNWWLKGNVQNPVEQRRHDLSDGFAILGLVNQAKLNGGMEVSGMNLTGPGSLLEIQNGNILLQGSSGSITLSSLLNKLNDYEQRIKALEEKP